MFIYVYLATDNLLVGFLTQAAFDNLQKHLLGYFTLTVQTGAVLKFLGLCIIQSDLGISIDQAEYTFELRSLGSYLCRAWGVK